MGGKIHDGKDLVVFAMLSCVTATAPAIRKHYICSAHSAHTAEACDSLCYEVLAFSPMHNPVLGLPWWSSG